MEDPIGTLASEGVVPVDHLNSHISFLSPMASIVHVVRLRYPGVELLLAVQRTKQKRGS